jgi:hypothetical protein
MADSGKCANLACTCIPPAGEKFCSAHCEAMQRTPEVVCQCGHPGCS